MPISPQKITRCLWFDREAEEAARFYTSIFPHSAVRRTTYYGKEDYEIHGMPEGTVITVEFEIESQTFTALNGGPLFKFNEAVSFQVDCETQEEIDYYWQRLGEGGDKTAQQCGWLKDKYGVSWQIGSRAAAELLIDPHSDKSQRAMKAFPQMKKIDLKAIKQAYDKSSL